MRQRHGSSLLHGQSAHVQSGTKLRGGGSSTSRTIGLITIFAGTTLLALALSPVQIWHTGHHPLHLSILPGRRRGGCSSGHPGAVLSKQDFLIGRIEPQEVGIVVSSRYGAFLIAIGCCRCTERHMLAPLGLARQAKCTSEGSSGDGVEEPALRWRWGRGLALLRLLARSRIVLTFLGMSMGMRMRQFNHQAFVQSAPIKPPTARNVNFPCIGPHTFNGRGWRGKVQMRQNGIDEGRLKGRLHGIFGISDRLAGMRSVGQRVGRVDGSSNGILRFVVINWIVISIARLVKIVLILFLAGLDGDINVHFHLCASHDFNVRLILLLLLLLEIFFDNLLTSKRSGHHHGLGVDLFGLLHHFQRLLHGVHHLLVSGLLHELLHLFGVQIRKIVIALGIAGIPIGITNRVRPGFAGRRSTGRMRLGLGGVPTRGTAAGLLLLLDHHRGLGLVVVIVTGMTRLAWLRRFARI
mmetsp:Transcript_18290/g.52344  ORF Transcript_18290/g.52344 Transcript_18290/m.52344 type:complete len:466 (+) Transcript_18290:968-2365(+)